MSTWLGGNGDWNNDPSFWSGGIVPPEYNDVAITGGSGIPSIVTLYSSPSVGNFTLDSGDKLVLGALSGPAANLTVTNTLTNNGTIASTNPYTVITVPFGSIVNNGSINVGFLEVTSDLNITGTGTLTAAQIQAGNAYVTNGSSQTLSLAGGAAVFNNFFNNGVFQGYGDVQANNTLQNNPGGTIKASGGQLSVYGIQNYGTLEAGTGGTLALYNTGNGVAKVDNGGTLLFGNGTTVSNMSVQVNGGNLTTTVSGQPIYGNTPFLLNSGSMTFSNSANNVLTSTGGTGSGFVEVGAGFNLSGAVNVQAYNVINNGTISATGSNPIVLENVSGSGTYAANGGTLSIQGGDFTGATVSVSGNSTLNLGGAANANMTVAYQGNLNLTGGNYTGSIQNTGTITMNSGTNYQGTLSNQAYGNLNVVGSRVYITSDTLTNSGTITVASGADLLFSPSAVTSYTMSGSGQLLLQGGFAQLAVALSPVPPGVPTNAQQFGVITNASTISGYGGIGAPLNNNGFLEAGSLQTPGTLQVIGPLVNTATVVIAPNSTLQVPNFGFYPADNNFTQTAGTTTMYNGTLSAPNVVINGGAVNFSGSELGYSGVNTIAGNLVINGGGVGDGTPNLGVATLNINGNLTLGAAGAISVNLAGIGSNTQINVSGTAALAGSLVAHLASPLFSELAVGDSFQILTYGSLSGNFSGFAPIGLGNNLELEEVIDPIHNAIDLSVFSTNSTTGIASGNSLQVTSNQDLSTPDFSNSGTVTVGNGSTLSVNAGSGTYTQDSGVTEINGTLSSSGATVNGGTLMGSGSVDGGLTNNGGTVKPGDSPGTLTVEGTYSQGADGTLEIQIGGYGAGVGYDQLAVTGEASLDGTLDVELIDGFTPVLGDDFIFLSYGTLSGGFTDFEGLNLGDGLVLVEYQDSVNDDLYLQVESASAAPEPGSWMLLLAGMAVVCSVKCISAERRGRIYCRPTN